MEQEQTEMQEEQVQEKIGEKGEGSYTLDEGDLDFLEDNKPYQLVYKFRETENKKAMALCRDAVDKYEPIKLRLPTVSNLNVVPGKESSATFSWELKWNRKYHYFPKVEVVLCLVKVEKTLDLGSVDPLSLIIPQENDNRKRIDLVTIAYAPSEGTTKETKSFFLERIVDETGPGSFFVAVYCRPMSMESTEQDLPSFLRKTIQYTTFKKTHIGDVLPTNMKLLIRLPPPPVLKLSALRITKDICILRWGFLLEQRGVTFEARMFVYNEQTDKWECQSNSHSFPKGLQEETLAFPLLHIPSNLAGARKIAIPGIPEKAKVKFVITSVDRPESVFDTKDSIVISGGIGKETTESNVVGVYNAAEDAEKNLCTICYDLVSFDELNEHTITEIPLDELWKQPTLHPDYPSGPNACCHVFHAKCLDEWTTKHKKKTCPNCQSRFNQQVMFCKFEHIVCVPIKR